MNVISLYSSSPNNVKTGQGPSGRPIQAEGRHPHLRKVADQVILSARAREALADMRERSDADSRITAGTQAGGLEARRAYEVVGRLERGYYTEAHVLQQVASRVGRDVAVGR